jgi:hypothetical protein
VTFLLDRKDGLFLLVSIKMEILFPQDMPRTERSSHLEPFTQLDLMVAQYLQAELLMVSLLVHLPITL